MGVLGQSQQSTGNRSGGGVLRRSRENKILSQEQSDMSQMADAGRIAADRALELTMLDQEQSDMAQMADASRALERERSIEKSRQLPVVGPVLRGLDAVSENPVVEKGASILRSLYTPGAGLGNVATLTAGAESAVAKTLPNLASSLGGRVASGALTEAAIGAPLGTAQYLASGGNDTGEAVKQGVLGGALGVVGGAAAPLIGKAVSGLARKTDAEQLALPSPTLALPEPQGGGTGVLGKAAAPKEQYLKTAPEPAEAMKQNWFTNLFGDRGVGISATSNAKRISKDPLTTADQIVKNPLKRDVEGTMAEIAAGTRAAYQGFVDVLDPLKHISKQAYEKAIDAARANNIANTIISDKFVTPQGQVLGPGLRETFQKVGRGQMDKFNDYLILRHAKTRMGRDERVYADNLKMTPEKVQGRIDDYLRQFPEFENIAKEWDQFNDNMLKTYGVDEDLLSQEMYDLLREKNPNYAPMRRQFNASEKFANPFAKSGSAFSGQKAPIKEVSPTGSVRRIVDPRRTTIEATGAWVNAAMRNRVMKSLVNAVQRDPDGLKGIVEIVQPPKGQKNLRDLLADEGSEGFVQALNDDFNNLFKPSSLDKDNIVRAMIKGEPVYLKVDNPEAVKALMGMGPDQSSLVLDFFGKLSDATKYGATGALAPMFAVKGLTTDIAQSIIQSKQPLRHIADLGEAIISSLADTLPKGTPGAERIRSLAQDFRRVGGEYSAALRGDRPLQRSVRSLDRDPLLSPKGVAKGVKDLAFSPFRALNKVSDIAENVNRMAAFRGEMRRLGDDRTPENVTQALNAAREITTNFSRKGSQSRGLEKIVPYQNAAIQGMYRFARQWKQNPVKTAALMGSAVLSPKLMEYSQFGEDPDYVQIPAREKYRNVYIRKNADGTFVKIPMPQEYNAIGALFVDVLNRVKDGNPAAFKETADALVNAYTPPLVSGLAQGASQGGGLGQSISGGLNSTVLAPAVAITSNRSFTGAPIESRALEARSPENRYDERTSSVAKALAKYVGLSPQKIDYVLRAYGGDPARLLLPLTSDVGAGNTRNTLLKNFITDPTFTNTLANDYYTGKEKLTQAAADLKAGVTPPAWYNEELRKEVTSTAKGSLSKRLSELGDQKDAINMDKTLAKEVKGERLKAIQQEINKIYIDINEKMYSAGVPRR